MFEKRPILDEDPIKKTRDALFKEISDAKQVLSEKRAKERESKVKSQVEL